MRQINVSGEAPMEEDENYASHHSVHKLHDFDQDEQDYKKKFPPSQKKKI